MPGDKTSLSKPIVAPPASVTVFLLASMEATMSLTTVTPCLRARPSYDTVMSAMLREPPSTRLDMGQETKLAFGSISTTSIV